MQKTRLATTTLIIAALACGDDVEPDAGEPSDARASDSSLRDVRSSDAARLDASVSDGSTFDGASADANVADAPMADPGDADVPFRSECLARRGPRTVLSGAQFERFRLSSLPDEAVFDATSAVWTGLTESGEAIPWTVTLRDGGTGDGACWFGGRIRGPWEDTAAGITWSDPYHHSGGMTIDVADFLVEGVRIDNQGDGLRPYGARATIRGVYLSDIHDDCVENDDAYDLLIEESLFDGCYVGFSARPVDGDVVDGSANLWEIRDSLVRLEPQPTVYRGPSPGHGGFFKWDSEGRSPQLSVHNTVFRADQAPNHGTIGIPEGLVMESCSGNTMVWLGDGDFPEVLPSCFTLTRDESVWTDAVAAWKARHPDIRE